MLCVGLLTTIKISGAAPLRGWVVSDAGLASGTAGLELVGAPGDLDSVSAPGLAVLGVWDSGWVWRRLEFGTRSWVWRCLVFETRGWVWRRLEFETRSRSGRSQEKQASLPEQQRSASGNVSSGH